MQIILHKNSNTILLNKLLFFKNKIQEKSSYLVLLNNSSLNKIIDIRNSCNDNNYIFVDEKEIEINRTLDGNTPFYYHDNTEFFICSTDITTIKAKINNITINKEWIVDHFSKIEKDTEYTIYNEIKRIPPNSKLIIKNDKISIKKNNLFYNSSITTIDLLKNIFIDTLKIVDEYERVGFELSGGLDSSAIITASQASTKNTELHAFRLILPNKNLNKIYPYTDERYYSDLIDKTSNKIKLHDVDSENSGLFNEMQNIIKILGTPTNNSLTFFFDDIIKEANKHNINLIISGWGGDQCISRNTYQYAIHNDLKILNYKQRIKWLLKNRLSKNNYDIKWYLKVYNNLYVNEELRSKYKILDKYKKLLMVRKFDTLDQYLKKFLESPYLSMRTETLSIIAKQYGIDYYYPLLNSNLLNSFFKLPEKIKAKTNRYVFREINKEFLPKEIYTRNDKTGATVPTVQQRFLKDYKVVEEFLYSNKNGKSAEYIDVQKMINNMLIIKNRNLNNQNINFPNQAVFFTSLMIMLFLENEF